MSAALRRPPREYEDSSDYEDDDPVCTPVGRDDRRTARYWEDEDDDGDDKYSLPIVEAGDIYINFNFPHTVELVDGLLSPTGFSVLYGASGSGKTFAAIDLACHVACDMPWRGMAVKQGKVIYVAAEAARSVQHRVYAWSKHHDVDNLPITIVECAVDLLSDVGVESILRLARKLGGLVR